MIDLITNLFLNINLFLKNGLENLTYIQLMAIVALESTAFPILVPVEAIVIPMGYLASIGKKNIIFLGLASSFGVVIGCLINYITSYFIGRFAIYKYSKYFFIKKETIHKIENLFLKNADFIIFIGRFIPIPGVKHLITLPAGFSKMNLKRFILFSFLGGLIFTSMNLAIGYFFGYKKDLAAKLLIIFMMIVILAVIIKIYRKKIAIYIKKIIN